MLTGISIIPIFAEPTGQENAGLYACKYPGHEQDALTELFYEWHDEVYLNRVCSKNTNRLTLATVFRLKIRPAVIQLLCEAKELESLLIPGPDNWYSGYPAEIGRRFEELHRTPSLHRKLKSIAVRSGKNLLRIYALSLTPELFIITGGGIKLTKSIQEDPALDLEYKKIKLVDRALRQSEISPSGFINQVINI